MYTVYSKPACPHCDQAKALLTAKGLDFTEVVLDMNQPKIDGKLYISRTELLEKFPAARTVPQIVLGDQHIGGFTDLRQSLLMAA